MFWNNKAMAVVALSALAACHKSSETAKAPEPAAAPAGPTVEVKRERWPESFEATGTVRARASMTIAGRVMGYVREIRPQAGDRVAAGQLLVKLEASELQASERQARAAVAEAQNGLPEARGAIASAEARLNLARTTERRMKELLDKKSVSPQEYDEAAARVRVAQAAVDMARAKERQLRDRIRQAEEAVQSAAAMLAYAEIRAPFAGRVTARKAEPGTMAAPGQPLLEIEQESGYRLEALVEEMRIAQVKRGQSVAVRLDAIAEPLTGRVGEIVPAAEEASRSFLVKIDLPTDAGIRSGMFGRAEFATGEREALVAPRASIRTEGQVQTALVVDNGVARSRLVRTGAVKGGMVEIVSGLEAGERVEVRQ